MLLGKGSEIKPKLLEACSRSIFGVTPVSRPVKHVKIWMVSAKLKRTSANFGQEQSEFCEA